MAKKARIDIQELSKHVACRRVGSGAVVYIVEYDYISGELKYETEGGKICYADSKKFCQAFEIIGKRA